MRQSLTFCGSLVILLCILALLICNSAAGLASRLAGSLAFAATAVLCALAKILGFDSSNVFHNNTSVFKFYHYVIHCITHFAKMQYKFAIFFKKV